MEKDSVEYKVNYCAVEKALSIALSEIANKDTRMVGLGRYKTTYDVWVPKHFLETVHPVMQKYIDSDDVEECIKNAQQIALSRMVRNWLWWSIAALFAGIICSAIHIIVGLIVFLVLLSIILLVFSSRNIVAKIWRNRPTTKDASAKAIEKMIEICKKNNVKICVDHLFKKQ